MASKFGSLFVDLIARTAGFETDMGRAARIAEQRSKQIHRSIQRGFTGAAASVTGFVTGLVGGLLSAQAAIQAFSNAINQADRLQELSERLGVSTEKLSEWSYAAKLSGTDMESLNGSLNKFSKTVAGAADASSRQAELFAALGINIKDAAGNLRSVQDLLPEVADRFKGLNNETTETALAMELFGRSGAEMLEFLNQGSAGLNQLGEEAQELGGIISGDTAKAAAQFNDELDRLKVVANSFFLQVARELLPALNDLTGELTDNAAASSKLSEAAKGTADFIKALGSIAAYAGGLVGALTDTFRAFIGVLATSTQLAQGFLTLDWGKIKGAASSLMEARSEYFQANANIAKGALTGSFAPSVTTPGVGSKGRAGSGRRGGAPMGMAPAFVPDMTASVNKFFANTAQAGKAAVKTMSEAERAAKQLTDEYQGIIDSQNEQIALFGKTGEAAKIRYQIETEDLSKLSAADALRIKQLQEKALAITEQADAQKSLDELEKAAYERMTKESEQFEEQQKRVQEYIQDMEFELSLYGQTAEKQREMIALRQANVSAMTEEGQRIVQLGSQIEDAAKKQDAWNEVQAELSDALYGVISRTKSAKEAVKDFFDAIEKQILRALADNWAKKITEMFSASGGSSGGTGDSGGGWTQAAASWISSLFSGARAYGGTVNNGDAYWVGERGPELFIPDTRGTVKPANESKRMMGGGGSVVNMSVHVQGTVSKRTLQQMEFDTGRATRRAQARNG